MPEHAGQDNSYKTTPITSQAARIPARPGVARPKIETADLRSRERPSSTSSTVPLKEANFGPTRAPRPPPKEIEGLGHSMPSCLNAGSAPPSSDRHRLVVRAEEVGDLGGVLDEVIGLVGEVHLHQHIAREELALGIDLLTTAHASTTFFSRRHDLFEQVLQVSWTTTQMNSATFRSKLECPPTSDWSWPQNPSISQLPMPRRKVTTRRMI